MEKIIIEKFNLHDLTGKIIGIAMEVHNQLGNCFQEVIYQRALEYEFGKNPIAFSREHEMEIVYKGFVVGSRRVDFFIENTIMVELKALAILENIHLAQAKNYLEAYKLTSRAIDKLWWAIFTIQKDFQ